MSTLRFEDFSTKDGFPNTRILMEGKKVSLHSVQPYKEAERVITRFNPELKWVLIAGCGLGYIIETLLEQTNYSILAYEHERHILERSFQLRHNEALYRSDRVNLVHDTDQLFDLMDEKGIKELSFYIHRPYLSLFGTIYQDLEGMMVSYLSKKNINKATLIRFQYVWLRNLIKNSAFFFDLPGLSDLDHNFGGSPALVIGAGPSLQASLPLIRERQDSCCIISTDTAYPILRSADIRPDFVVSVDPQNKNSQFLLYAGKKDSCLVLDATGSFISFAKSGITQLMFYDSIFPVYDTLSSFWGEKGQLLSGGSVSTNAFDLARQLKCDPIIFCGQDLAFPDSRIHAHGNILEDFLYYQVDRLNTVEQYNVKMLVMSDRIHIESNDGNKVSTDRKFLTYLDWFRRQIKNTSARVINTSPQGARIQGAEFQPLDRVLHSNLPPIQKGIRFSHQSGSPKKYEAYLHEILQSIRRLIPEARQALNAARQCSTRAGDKNQKHFQKMSNFDQSLIRTMKTGQKTARFLELGMQSSIEKMAELSSIDSITDELIQGWRELYHEAYKGLRFIERMILKHRQILSERTLSA